MKLSFFFFIITFTSIGYAQSNIELEKEYNFYQVNKVKLEIIENEKGDKSITKYDKRGRPTETISFYNSIESAITSYKYNKKGNLVEESYYGFESGDGFLKRFYYDEIGNIQAIISEGSDSYEKHLIYDSEGNILQENTLSQDLHNLRM